MEPHRLHLSTPVEGVRAAGGAVGVCVGAHTVHTQRVVLAIPPALAVARLELDPALVREDARRIAAMTPVWMGATAKVVVRYAEPFWRAAGLAGAAMSMRGPLQEIHDMSGPDGRPAALFGFARAGAEEGELARDAVDQLVRTFGAAAGHPLGCSSSTGAASPTPPRPGSVDCWRPRCSGTPRSPRNRVIVCCGPRPRRRGWLPDTSRARSPPGAALPRRRWTHGDPTRPDELSDRPGRARCTQDASCCTKSESATA